MSELTFNKLASPPSPPAVDKVTMYANASGDTKKIDENGIITGFDKIYGSNYSKAYSDQTITNTSITPLLYTSMTMFAVPAGAMVKLEAFAVWNMSVTNKLFNSVLYVNGVPVGSLSEKTNDTGNDVRNPRSGFFFFPNPTTQDLIIEMKFYPESAGTTATMYYGAVEGKRVE